MTAGVETRVLHDDRNVGAKQGRIGAIPRNRLGIAQVIETKVARALRLDFELIGTPRSAIFEIKHYLDGCLNLASIQDARRLMGYKIVAIADAFAWYITFGNGPNAMADQFVLQPFKTEHFGLGFVPPRIRV